jgi:Tfp pilus assembly protein PilF
MPMEISDSFRIKLGHILTELTNVGAFLRENGFPERAVQVFLTLSEDDPSFEAGSYAFELGLCYEAIGDLTKAREYFDIAVRENPEITQYRAAATRTR